MRLVIVALLLLLVLAMVGDDMRKYWFTGTAD
jgi:hypothetical protein